MPDGIQKKRFCRASCSCQTKRKLRGIYRTSWNYQAKLKGKGLTESAEVVEQDSKEEVFTGPAGLTKKKTQRRGFTELAEVAGQDSRKSFVQDWLELSDETQRRRTYRTRESCRDATQKEEVLKM